MKKRAPWGSSFESLLEKSGDCLLYTAAKNEFGYGVFRDGYAHRVAYQKAYGPIPDGMTVDHICFTRACCNPKHLQLLTHSQNSSRQRSALSMFCRRGHELSGSNLYIHPSGKRRCMECVRALNRKMYKRRNPGASQKGPMSIREGLERINRNEMRRPWTTTPNLPPSIKKS